MSTINKDTPPAPVEWGKPEEQSSATAPEDTFHDDAVGGLIKSREANQLRASQDQAVGLPPRSIVKFNKEVGPATAFRPTTQDGPEIWRAKQSRGGPVTEADPKQPGRQKAKRRVGHPKGSVGRLSAAESAETGRELERLERFIERLNELERQVADSAARLPPTDLASRAAALALQQRRLEAQVRFACQGLLAGGLGFALLNDPRRTFERLIRRWRPWPRRIRPGHLPETDEEMDQFLAWVFEPPTLPEV
jgi:hypothetical protein